MNDEIATVLIVGILSILVAAFARLYLSARGDAIRAEVRLKTESNLREAIELQLSQVEERLAAHQRSEREFVHREFALRCEIRQRDAMIAACMSMVSSSAASSPVIDDQTKALVRLATSNPNEHEQHAAAMLVCKRLRGKIDT